MSTRTCLSSYQRWNRRRRWLIWTGWQPATDRTIVTTGTHVICRWSSDHVYCVHPFTSCQRSHYCNRPRSLLPLRRRRTTSNRNRRFNGNRYFPYLTSIEKVSTIQLMAINLMLHHRCPLLTQRSCPVIVFSYRTSQVDPVVQLQQLI